MAVHEVTTNNFEAEVLQSTEPVLVDFWAEWCGPCRMVSPFVEEIAIEMKDKLKVCKVNIDDHPALAKKFGVMSIPCLIVLKNGKVAASLVGARPKAEIIRILGL
jgi:thioredoxin 1